MPDQSFTTTILVDQSPRQAFDAINNVRGWWSEEVKGRTEKLNDEFHYHYMDVHSCTMKLIEVIPDKKVVWLVTANDFNFIKDKTEWIGTHVVFEITPKNGQTQIQFTHEGLVPQYECFDVCYKAWTGYITKSLPSLIATGKGNPNPKES